MKKLPERVKWFLIGLGYAIAFAIVCAGIVAYVLLPLAGINSSDFL